VYAEPQLRGGERYKYQENVRGEEMKVLLLTTWEIPKSVEGLKKYYNYNEKYVPRRLEREKKFNVKGSGWSDGTGKCYMLEEFENYEAFAKYMDDERPVDENCRCYTCSHFSRSYLRHLFMAKEILAYRLNTVHNLHYYSQLMSGIRQAIKGDQMDRFRWTFYENRTLNREEVS